ncbi:MAG TPA: hypothetical protein VFV07_10795 [Rhizomicrobium sp.]|nr:hypothetical protein [Rhizomicrobium sp.]
MKTHIVAGRCVALALLLGATTAAHAQLVISKKPTSNVTCAAGICSATAPQAVLNEKDMKKLLQKGDLEVAGGAANSIQIVTKVSWVRDTRLTLNANAVYVAARVRVIVGSLTVTTPDFHGGANLAFSKEGNIAFFNFNEPFILNGVTYKLEPSLFELFRDIASNGNSGSYALADNDDGSNYGTFSASPISDFSGNIEGLGHTISNLHINDPSGDTYVAFIGRLESGHSVRNLSFTQANVQATGGGSCVSALVGDNLGSVGNSYVSGTVSASQALDTGGAVACDFGTIFGVSADIATTGNTVGGLVGLEQGTIIDSMASGPVDAQAGPNLPSGGGLIGNAGPCTVQSSYSSGKVTSTNNLGGLAGQAFGCTFTDVYWDPNTSGTGKGCVGSCDGVVGLTTKQLRSGLPAGFDPATWAENHKIENGLPYLLAAAPR